MNILIQVKRREFVQCLIELLTVAIDNNLLDEAEDMLSCLRQLRPKFDHLDCFEGWLAVLRGDWQTGMRIARGSVERTPDWAQASLLLALCQYATGDKTWEVSAERLLNRGEASDMHDVIKFLLGRTGPQDFEAPPAQPVEIEADGGDKLLIERNFMRA